jgi:hypothetical protein
MDFFERCFVVLTVVGSLGVIAVVIWMKVALSNDGASTGAAALHAAIGIDRVSTTVRSRTHQRPS